MIKTKDQKGFTLVELAIVMIIIGLLISGVLKGQELINQSNVSATISKIKALDGALLIFIDKYNAPPGDIANAATLLPNCDQFPCSTTNGASGTGLIGNGLNVLNAPNNNDEGVRAFRHMAAANLITGVNIYGTRNFGDALPSAPVAGGFWICYDGDGNLGAGTTQGRAGHYFTLHGLLQDVTATSVTDITANEGVQIDKKLDDGNARSGDILATGSNCTDGVGVYQEGNANASCAIFISTSM